jgi:hypothetical protein
VIHTRDWADLRAHFDQNDHYPADITWNGLRMRNVGVRSRGLSSRSSDKPGLELDFGYYAATQRFLGLRALVLDNLVTDPSMIREAVAMALRHRGAARGAGTCSSTASTPAYMLVEPVDTVFTARHFDGGGLLFEYRWTYPFYATFPGESLDPYAVLFESRSPGVHAMAELYSPMRELFRTINEAPDGSFDQVNRYLNLARFIRMVGASTFMAEWDGVLGYDGEQLHLYRLGEQARSSVDRDQASRRGLSLSREPPRILMRRMTTRPSPTTPPSPSHDWGDNWLEELARHTRSSTTRRWPTRSLATNDSRPSPHHVARTRPAFARPARAASVEGFRRGGSKDRGHGEGRRKSRLGANEQVLARKVVVDALLAEAFVLDLELHLRLRHLVLRPDRHVRILPVLEHSRPPGRRSRIRCSICGSLNSCLTRHDDQIELAADRRSLRARNHIGELCLGGVLLQELEHPRRRSTA